MLACCHLVFISSYIRDIYNKKEREIVAVFNFEDHFFKIWFMVKQFTLNSGRVRLLNVFESAKIKVIKILKTADM